MSHEGKILLFFLVSAGVACEKKAALSRDKSVGEESLYTAFQVIYPEKVTAALQFDVDPVAEKDAKP